MDGSVITWDEIIDVEEANPNEKNITCKPQHTKQNKNIYYYFTTQS